MGLLNHVHGATLVLEDIRMDEVKILAVFLVWDEVFAAGLTGDCRRALVCAMDAVLFKELSECCARCHCTLPGEFRPAQFFAWLSRRHIMTCFTDVFTRTCHAKKLRNAAQASPKPKFMRRDS